jgi:AcrR family transcriptional regulator
VTLGVKPFPLGRESDRAGGEHLSNGRCRRAVQPMDELLERTVRYRMVVRQDVKRRRLSAEDWAEAALDAIGEQGLIGVAVEPIAARLGATKGSFYWHFPNRDALVLAALRRWEQTTEVVIRALDDDIDPPTRLRNLFVTTTAAPPARVEVNLLAAADHPLVAPTMRRVVDRRVSFTRALFVELGFTKAEATRRALLAYTVYTGHLQLVVRMPEALPQKRPARTAYLETVLEALTSRH